jgi:enamine deaminase RidA (YjgF/YER057c/UK114 family)
MTPERLNPPSLASPAGFSHAVVAAGSRMIFLAGQTATDSAGTITGAGIAGQFEQALANLLRALGAAGGGAADLCSLTIYVTDLAGYQAHRREIGAAWRRLAGPQYPAMAAVEVRRLWDRAALVEIQGMAMLP